MYTKQEISKQKQAFWTSFGRYMKPILSSDGEAISWMNYKTGNKYVSFKMDVDGRRALVSIVIDHPDAAIREWYFDRLVRMRVLFYETLEEEGWVWKQEDTDEQGRNPVSSHWTPFGAWCVINWYSRNKDLHLANNLHMR